MTHTPLDAHHYSKQEFENELSERRDLVRAYLLSERYINKFGPLHLREAVYSYVKRGGKMLRSNIVLMSCGAVGGNEADVVPTAAAIEIYHTMSLVHDDIVDRDDKRRGEPTVHIEFRDRAISEFHYSDDEAKHYGQAIALLAGDMQHSLSISLLCEQNLIANAPADVVLHLIRELTDKVGPTLVEGEALDILYSRLPIESLTREMVIDMLWKKTSALFQFSSKAGAALGLRTTDYSLPNIHALGEFVSKCGVAFQLRDDVLGLVADEKVLGKPVGSDIREGKRTIPLLVGMERAGEEQKAALLAAVGNPAATAGQITEATRVLHDLGAIEYTEQLSNQYISEAMEYLAELPASRYTHLFADLANYMVERQY